MEATTKFMYYVIFGAPGKFSRPWGDSSVMPKDNVFYSVLAGTPTEAEKLARAQAANEMQGIQGEFHTLEIRNLGRVVVPVDQRP